MNTNDIIKEIMDQVPANAPAAAKVAANWVKSNAENITYQDVPYIVEHYQCMENYGLEPSGVVAEVYLNAAHDQIVQMSVANLMEHVDYYQRIMDLNYGQGLDHLRKR